MSEFSYASKLKEKYHIDDMGKTLIYRIDSFIEACNMDLENCYLDKEISSTMVPYINAHSDEEENKYSVNFSYHYDREKGKQYTLLGKYHDLTFYFINYYDKDKNKNKINEIPFTMSLDKIFKKFGYALKIESANGSIIRVILIKYRNGEKLHNKISFVSNIKSFDDVFGIIESFVSNPKLLFNTYNEIMSKKDVVFSAKEFRKPQELTEKVEKTSKR